MSFLFFDLCVRVLGILKAMNNLIMFLWVFYEEFWMIISVCRRLLVQPLQHWKRLFILNESIQFLHFFKFFTNLKSGLLMIGGCWRVGTALGNHIKAPDGCVWEISGDFLTLKHNSCLCFLLNEYIWNNTTSLLLLYFVLHVFCSDIFNCSFLF